MQAFQLKKLLDLARSAAVKAGHKILEVYHSDHFEIELKADQSPLTKADKAAHDIIQEVLETTGIPILSEEGREMAYEERENWKYLWIVDPLDGTKEFIKRNGEFTVNIALVKDGVPVLGVIYVPVQDKLYAGAKNLGAMLRVNNQERVLSKMEKVDLREPGLRVVASRSYLNKETEAFLKTLTEPVVVTMGSSLKFMMLAEGLADIYPRFAPTMEWDTAAAQAILKVLGGDVIDKRGISLSYNKINLLNPYFRAP